MDILEYKTFKEDVIHVMKTLIDNYNFKVYNEPEDQLLLKVWLENNTCKIYLDGLASFPRIGIGLQFYIKVKGELVEITSKDLFNQYDVNQKDYNSFVLNLNEAIPEGNDLFGYHKPLAINESLILKYYMPLVNNIEC